ncbi:MAG: ABC transporter permease [Candidatus Methanoperedens sp.]|nr:ABC transporter permease [Candidatus Methanoperedens sp.]MCZ7369743.1 ABC transporter permease [Candidatus Methanoperedens sp.]
MGNVTAVAQKEMKSLLSEKTLILAIIIQLMLASFSSLLVIGLASFFDPSALDKYDAPRAKVGIVGGGDLKQFIGKSQVAPHYYIDLPSALADFNNNKIDAVLVVPAVSPDGNEIIQLVLYLPKSDIKGTLVTLALKKPLEDFETYVRDARNPRTGFEPIRLYVDDVPKKTSTYFEFIYGILIPLLVFTPVFISGGLIIDMITEEYERKTMDLLLVSPVSFLEIIYGKMITAVMIVPLQAFLWLALLRFNHIEVHNTWLILLLAGIVASVIVLVGAIVAVRYRERIISQYVYSLILILLFMGGYLFANSPFNLVTRLSSGAAGSDVLVFFGLYAFIALPLYIYIRNMDRNMN